MYRFQNHFLACNQNSVHKMRQNANTEKVKVSIDSKSSNRCKMVGAKFYDLFLLAEWIGRKFSYLSITLPKDF